MFTMVVYIEYAILQNMLCDATLLCLARTITKQNLSIWRILFAATFGTAFAILTPFLRFPNGLFYVVKFAVGALMCMFAMPRLKTKNDWGRYALSLLFFYAFTFFFGGAILGIYGGFSVVDGGGNLYEVYGVSGVVIAFAFAALCLICVFLIKVLYRKRAIHRFIYPCRLYFQGNTVFAEGFLDSGNLALHNATPICFLSPDCFYNLCGEEFLRKTTGQVCDEMQIQTISGGKKVALYLGEIEVENTKNNWVKSKTYFALSANMIAREYQVLLNAATLDVQDFGGVK